MSIKKNTGPKGQKTTHKFKVGSKVHHERLGVGVVIGFWGSLLVSEKDISGRNSRNSLRPGSVLIDCQNIIDTIMTKDGQKQLHSCRAEYLKKI